MKLIASKEDSVPLNLEDITTLQWDKEKYKVIHTETSNFKQTKPVSGSDSEGSQLKQRKPAQESWQAVPLWPAYYFHFTLSTEAGRTPGPAISRIH